MLLSTHPLANPAALLVLGIIVYCLVVHWQRKAEREKQKPRNIELDEHENYLS